MHQFQELLHRIASQSIATRSVRELMQLDRDVRQARLWGASPTWMDSLDRAIATRLLELPLGVASSNQPSGAFYPLGAFADTQRAASDSSRSTDRQTFRILNAAHQTLSLAQLAALDADSDGYLTVQEMTHLWAWSDTNEDGRLGVGNRGSAELLPLFTALRRNGESRLSARAFAMHTAGTGSYGHAMQGGISNDYLEGDYQSNLLRGAAGADYLVGHAGDDYLDGGTGDDWMRGGEGNDVYIVNSVNDQIQELSNQGHDTVYSAISYTLGTDVEDLILLSGASVNATGNGLNNVLIGNASDNILDGVTGADTMVGGRGNDFYYVDNVNDQVVEVAGEGRDTVNARISYVLGGSVENLTLLDFNTPMRGSIDGRATWIYGDPKAYPLDCQQGNAVDGFLGTCGLVVIANIMAQSGASVGEAEVIARAIANRWATIDEAAPAAIRGGSTSVDQCNLLDSFGIANDLLAGFKPEAIANLIRSGRGVLLAVESGVLWNKPGHVRDGVPDHAVTVTGYAASAVDGTLQGFYIADSARGWISDMTRYVALADLTAAADMPAAYCVYTTAAIKLRDENINASGNYLNNVLCGNQGNNVLTGGLGYDILRGGLGNDTYRFNAGDGYDTIMEDDATPGNCDTLRFTGLNDAALHWARAGDALKISVEGSLDQVTIADWYVPGVRGSDHQIERIETDDGRAWSNTQVDALVQSMARFAWQAPGGIDSGRDASAAVSLPASLLNDGGFPPQRRGMRR